MAKPGKYDAIVQTLKHAEPADAPYQERVNQTKDACQQCGAINPEGADICINKDTGELFPQHLVWSTLNAVALSAAYIALRYEKQVQEAAEKALNLKIEACTQLLVASQDRGDEGWGKYGVKDNALRLENGDTIRVHAEPYGQVKDKEAFRLWCIANGYERQLQLWPSTMNALAKERRVNGDPDPDGVEVFRKEQVKFIAAGKDE